jgi:hypothetical protein
MDEASGMDGGQRAAEILAEEGRLAPAEGALSLEQLFERVAADELHPQADAAVVRVDAVHRHHVAVPDAREQPAFVQDLGGEQIGGAAARPEELHRDVTAERSVEGAEDFAVDAGPNALLQQEGAPGDAGGGRLGVWLGGAAAGRQRARGRTDVPDHAAADVERGRRVARRRVEVVGAAVDVADRGDDPQPLDQCALALIGGERRGGIPVDGFPVGDRGGNVQEG